jgi:hypothetical protein
VRASPSGQPVTDFIKTEVLTALLELDFPLRGGSTEARRP